MNKFWKLILPSTLAPRHNGKLVPVEKQGSLGTYASFYDNPTYEWSVTITIDQPSKIVFVDSPSHKIIKPSELNKTLINVQMDNKHPTKDFCLLFATENIH